MKAIIEVYYCDFCGNEITQHPFLTDPYDGGELPLPDGHVFAGSVNSNEEYHTVWIDGENVIFCQGCSVVIKAAIKFGLVQMPSEVKYEIYHDAGYRMDGDKWIPGSLYNIRKEKGLIND